MLEMPALYHAPRILSTHDGFLTILACQFAKKHKKPLDAHGCICYTLIG